MSSLATFKHDKRAPAPKPPPHYSLRSSNDKTFPERSACCLLRTHLVTREVCRGVAETDPAFEVDPQEGTREFKDPQDENLGARVHPVE